MKILRTDFSNGFEVNRYDYPQGIDGINEFIASINNSGKQFIEMRQYDTENCVFPYLVKEDTRKVFLNFSTITTITEEEAEVLSREEYDKRLAVCVQEKCLDCESYKEDLSGDNLTGHRGKLSLDGECYLYTQKSSEQD